jgi:hypothetical protein
LDVSANHPKRERDRNAPPQFLLDLVEGGGDPYFPRQIPIMHQTGSPARGSREEREGASLAATMRSRAMVDTRHQPQARSKLGHHPMLPRAQQTDSKGKGGAVMPSKTNANQTETRDAGGSSMRSPTAVVGRTGFARQHPPATAKGIGGREGCQRLGFASPLGSPSQGRRGGLICLLRPSRAGRALTEGET